MLKNQILANPITWELVQKQNISYLVISDIHLGVKRVSVRSILSNLKTVFTNFDKDGPMTKLDIVFIAGDLFDQALWFTNEDIVLIISFIRDLMGWCEHHAVALRILEGTPSHDRHQPRNLVPIAENFPRLDFRYVETMCVEAFNDLGITCLYVPDEFGGSAEKAQGLILNEVHRLGLSRVDIAIMHGMFKYQVPEITSDRYKYDEEFFLNLVRWFINIGHVHRPSTYERILAQGSFDRIAHNEEHAKGCMLMELDTNVGNKFFFIENKGAAIFKTIHVRWKDLERAVAQVRNVCSELPDNSHVRIKAAKGHPVLNVFDQLARECNGLNFSKITEEEEEEKQKLYDSKALLTVDYTPIHIDKENIVPMLMTEVRNNFDFKPYLLDKLQQKLELLK